MKSIAMKYALFLGFVVLTALVTRPIIQKAQIPLLKDVI